MFQPRMRIVGEIHRIPGHVNKPGSQAEPVTPIFQAFIVFPFEPQTGKDPVGVQFGHIIILHSHTRLFGQPHSRKGRRFSTVPRMVLRFIAAEGIGGFPELIAAYPDTVGQNFAFFRRHHLVSTVITPHQTTEQVCRLQVSHTHTGTAFRVPGTGNDQSLFFCIIFQFNIIRKDGGHPQFLQIAAGTGHDPAGHFAVPFHPGTDIGVSTLLVRFGIGRDLQQRGGPLHGFDQSSRIRIPVQSQFFHPGAGAGGKGRKVIFRHTPGMVQSRNFHIFKGRRLPGGIALDRKVVDPRLHGLGRNKIGGFTFRCINGFAVLRTGYRVGFGHIFFLPGNQRKCRIGQPDTVLGIIERVFFKPHVFHFKTDDTGRFVIQAAVKGHPVQGFTFFQDSGLAEFQTGQRNRGFGPCFRRRETGESRPSGAMRKIDTDITLLTAGNHFAPVLKAHPVRRIITHPVQTERQRNTGQRNGVFHRKDAIFFRTFHIFLHTDKSFGGRKFRCRRRLDKTEVPHLQKGRSGGFIIHPAIKVQLLHRFARFGRGLLVEFQRTQIQTGRCPLCGNRDHIKGSSRILEIKRHAHIADFASLRDLHPVVKAQLQIRLIRHPGKVEVQIGIDSGNCIGRRQHAVLDGYLMIFALLHQCFFRHKSVF